MKTVTVTSEGNGLSVNFELAHTGYETKLERVLVSITCRHEENIPIEDHLNYSCTRDCFHDVMKGSGFMRGPVLAGVSYTCSGKVWTNNGSNDLDIGLFNASIGEY